MKASTTAKNTVAECYRAVTNKHPRIWIIKTTRYVSVKILDRHLSEPELEKFNNMLQVKFGDDFLRTKNDRTRGTKDDAPQPKVVVRFRSSHTV